MGHLIAWTDRNRKIAASAVALVCMMGYAIYRTAPFDQVANSIEWILGIFITGHTAANAVNTWGGSKAPPVAKPKEG